MVMLSICFFALFSSTAYAQTQDTYIRLDTADTNFGSRTYLKLNDAGLTRSRLILGFDVPAVPSRSIVGAAKLRLYYYTDFGAGSGTRTVTAHRLTRDNWGEGNGTDGPTWNEYQHIGASHPASCFAWTTSGGDYDTGEPPIGVAPISRENYGWIEWDVTAAVQDAVMNGDAVVAILLKQVTEDKLVGLNQFDSYFRSSNYATDPSLRPRLDITWALPPTGYNGPWLLLLAISLIATGVFLARAHRLTGAVKAAPQVRG